MLPLMKAMFYFSLAAMAYAHYRKSDPRFAPILLRVMLAVAAVFGTIAGGGVAVAPGGLLAGQTTVVGAGILTGVALIVVALVVSVRRQLRRETVGRNT